jgi:hypothetical protein
VLEVSFLVLSSSFVGVRPPRAQSISHSRRHRRSRIFRAVLRDDAVDLTGQQHDEMRSLLARTLLSILWRQAPRIRATSAVLRRDAASRDLVVRVQGFLWHEHEPSAIDFHLRRSVGGSLRVADLVTEGSTSSQNIGDQIQKRMAQGPGGYSDVVARLQRKIEQPRR